MGAPEEPNLNTLRELEEMKKEIVSIPCWPKGATMEIKLGKREFFLPVSVKNDLLEMKKIKARVKCHIDENGHLDFILKHVGWNYLLGLIDNVFVFSEPMLLVFHPDFCFIHIKSVFKNITNSVLFRQFHEEIINQAEKCFSCVEKEREIATRKNTDVLKYLEETALDNYAVIKGYERAKKDLEAGVERVRRDLGTARSLDLQDPTENPSAPFLSPKTEILEN